MVFFFSFGLSSGTGTLIQKRLVCACNTVTLQEIPDELKEREISDNKSGHIHGLEDVVDDEDSAKLPLSCALVDAGPAKKDSWALWTQIPEQ